MNAPDLILRTFRDPNVIDGIRERYRQRDDLVRTQGNLDRQIKASCRRAVGFSTFDEAKVRTEKMKQANALLDEIESGQISAGNLMVSISASTLIPLRDAIASSRKSIEKALVIDAKTLLIDHFVDGIKGFGYIGLATIIAEAGDLSNYANPAKLWKRMGLAVLDGERQRKKSNPDDALVHGYSPRRRSAMYVIGDSMIKSQGKYREIYLARLATEHAKAIAGGLIPATTTEATVTSWNERGLPALTRVKKLDATQHRSAGHMANRAQRYMEKRLLRDLWKAWNNDSSPT